MKQLNNLPFAPVVGAMFAVVAAILVIATPQFLFDRAIAGSGLPELFAAAAPPLGPKARVGSAMVAASLVGFVVWLSLAKLELAAARRAPLARGQQVRPTRVTAGLERVHAVRPQPIHARADLGAPFMSDEAIIVARDELLLDPAMIEAQTASRPRHPPAPAPVLIGSAPANTVHGLLNRLEEALERREQRVGASPPAPGDMASLKAALGLRIAA